MNKNIGFSLFGTVNGFEVNSFGFLNMVPNVETLLDIKPSYVPSDPSEALFLISKNNLDSNQSFTIYSLYKFAMRQSQSYRDGEHIGCCVAIKGVISKKEMGVVYRALILLMQEGQENCENNGRFKPDFILNNFVATNVETMLKAVTPQNSYQTVPTKNITEALIVIDGEINISEIFFRIQQADIASPYSHIYMGQEADLPTNIKYLNTVDINNLDCETFLSSSKNKIQILLDKMTESALERDKLEEDLVINRDNLEIIKHKLMICNEKLDAKRKETEYCIKELKNKESLISKLVLERKQYEKNLKYGFTNTDCNKLINKIKPRNGLGLQSTKIKEHRSKNKTISKLDVLILAVLFAFLFVVMFMVYRATITTNDTSSISQEQGRKGGQLARVEKARAEKARAEKARAEKARAEKARAEKARAEAKALTIIDNLINASPSSREGKEYCSDRYYNYQSDEEFIKLCLANFDSCNEASYGEVDINNCIEKSLSEGRR